MARSFAIILLCVVVVFTTEALQNRSVSNWGIDTLLAPAMDRHCIPAGRLSASFGCAAGDSRASLARPPTICGARHVRRLALFLLALATGYLLGPLVPNGKPAPHLQRTSVTEVFTAVLRCAMVWAGINFARAFSL